MQRAQKKYITLDIKTKMKVLKDVDEKIMNKTDIAKKYGIPRSTLSTILKDRAKINKAYEAGMEASRMRPTRDAAFPKMEDALISWIQIARKNNCPVDGNVVKEKADTIALRMGIEGFRASDGWLHRFKGRHGLTFKKICGESAAVDKTQTDNWKEQKLKRLLRDYKPDDIYNADETGLFFKVLPDRTLVFKGETGSGGKRSKERITLLLACNMTGTHKLKLLVIAKSKNPRCFKGIPTLPVMYRHNTKAWMNQEIWQEFLIIFDRHMTAQDRKILLIVDNCTAHGEVRDLKSIRVEYFPPNTTSVLQPLDQGIIQNFKKIYRKTLLKRLILCFENNQPYNVNLLSAIQIATAAWRDVTADTILHCFRHAGFDLLHTSLVPSSSTATDVTGGGASGAGEFVSSGEDSSSNAIEVVSGADESLPEENEGNLLLLQLRKYVKIPEDISFQDYQNVDKSVSCSAEISMDEAIEMAIGNSMAIEDDHSSEEECESEESPPSIKEAANAACILRKFFESRKDSGNDLAAIIKIESSIVGCLRDSVKQTKLTEFFTKK